MDKNWHLDRVTMIQMDLNALKCAEYVALDTDGPYLVFQRGKMVEALNQAEASGATPAEIHAAKESAK